MTSAVRDNADAYRLAVRADNPNLYFRLRESSGNFTDDANAQVGTAAGVVTYSVASTLGASDTAISFAGAGVFSVADGTYTDLGDVLTIECWVKRGTIGSQQVLFSKGTNAYQFWIGAGNTLNFSKQAVSLIVQSTTTITDTTAWHHVAVTKNGATVKLYIDGVDRTGAVTNATLADTAQALVVGSFNGSSLFYNGALDEVAVYPTALSATRIAAHYAAGTAQTFAALSANALSMSALAGTGSGQYPASTLYPSSTLYTGGWALVAASTNSLTLTAA